MPQVSSVYTALIVLLLSGSATLAGLGASFTWGGRTLVVYFSGGLMDRVGRMPIIVVGLLICAIASVSAGLAALLNSLAGFLGSLFLMGIGFGMVQQSRVAISDMFPPSKRGRALGIFFTAPVVGSFLATFLVALSDNISKTTQVSDLSLSWLIVTPFLLLAALLSKAVKPDPLVIAKSLESYYEGNPAVAPSTSAAQIRHLREALTRPVLVAFMASATVWGLMIAFMLLGSIVMNEHHISRPAISLAVTLHVVGMFALSIPFGRLTDMWGRRPVMAIGCFLCGIGAFITPLTPDFYTITLGLFLVGLGWSAASIASTALISDHTYPAERGKVLGANDLTTGLAALSFPFASGFVIEAAGLYSLAIFGLAASLPAIMVSVIAKPTDLLSASSLKR